MSNQALAKAIDFVVFLFAAFGGFLTAVAPPGEADSRFAVGFASILTLLVLLFVSALVQMSLPQRYSAIFLIAAGVLALATLGSGVLYKHNLDELTFSFDLEEPPVTYVRGTKYTPKAEKVVQDAMAKGRPIPVAELVGGFGPPPASIPLVWTEESVLHARELLVWNYVLFVLCFAAAVCCLTEGCLPPAATPAAPPPPAPPPPAPPPAASATGLGGGT